MFCLLVLACGSASAQKKAETKLYNKTIGNPSLAAFDKFLKKYPESVYAPSILGKKDTLLNVSPYTMEDAARIASDFLPGAEFKAWGVRKEAVDRIQVLAVNADSLDLGYIRLATLVDGKDGWELEYSYDLPGFEDEEMASVAFVDGCSFLKILKKDCLRFNCLMKSADGSRQDYVAAIYNTADEQLYRVVFSGKDLPGKEEGLYRIQGRKDFTMESSGSNRPELLLLAKEIDENPALVAVSDADFLTDEAMQFWLKNNPDALTTATKVAAATLPAESSLVQAYAAAKGKQNSSKYRAAMFDFRGYTVIVAYQKASDDYILAWVEPECKDHYRDRLLNSISFSDSNTLEMFYYHGNRTFKYHLNLASKSLKRK